MAPRIIIFNNSLDDLVDIKQCLSKSSYKLVSVCHSLTEMSQAVITNDINLVMVVTDKKFDPLFATVRQINKQHPIPFIIFTYEDNRCVIESAIKAGVSAYIVDGLQANRVISILDTAHLLFNEQQRVKTELEKTKTTLAERKLIDKAKGILMQRSAQDEDSIYKSMRKAAMDKNIKIAELAKSIIDSHELMT